ncbi:GerAB/ArcD/ProY family transporter [Paenibacillus endoradicis]|uniref:GerAB/ArcD/ProY family transporter n=1 Tax=Paenibacillus endoradicis TaxID=2972487 RepID=UPI0021592467|nr:spore germination protein [Paenibacillus endoradicis]MCR8658730.1 spore germination protein [Paenibacillus endoradicis]
MIKAENKISQFQLFFIILQTQIGIGVISLPYDVYRISSNDAWISVFIAGLFIQIGIIVIWLLCRQYPQQTIFELMGNIVGKYIAYILKIGYFTYFFLSAILIAFQFGEKVNIWILPLTPIWVIIVLLILISVYCVKENLKVMARFFVVVSLLLVVLLAFTLFVLKDINFLYILPIGESGFSNMVKGSTKATFAFQGFELMLVVMPYCLGKGIGKLKVALTANGFVTIFYTYLTFITITYFGTAALKFIPEPILYIMKFKYFNIIDRVDLVFFSIWVVSVATSFMMYLYLSSIGITHMFRKTDRTNFVYFSGAAMLIIVLSIPVNNKVIQALENFTNIYGILFLFIVPLTLLVVSVIRNKKEKEDVPL